MTHTIKIDGIDYRVRYAYKRDDGTTWYVLLDAEGFYGEHGDEWPEKQVIRT